MGGPERNSRRLAKQGYTHAPICKIGKRCADLPILLGEPLVHGTASLSVPSPLMPGVRVFFAFPKLSPSPGNGSMNRQETFDLFQQGADAWNAWADDMLSEKQDL